MFSSAAARFGTDLKVLKRFFRKWRGAEIAAGQVSTLCTLRELMPSLTWLILIRLLSQYRKLIKFTGLSNVLPPLDIDVCAKSWSVGNSAA